MAPDWFSAEMREALDAEIRACWQPSGGAVADTFVVELEGGSRRVVCKRGGASIWTGDVIEPLVTGLVARETDLPVPEVLAHGSLRNVDSPTRWALYEYCDGVQPTVATPERRARLATRAGDILG